MGTGLFTFVAFKCLHFEQIIQRLLIYRYKKARRKITNKLEKQQKKMIKIRSKEKGPFHFKINT